MGASIFFSKDESIEKSEDRFTSTFIHRSYWDAFGDLLDAAFLPNYPELHKIIKSEEGEYLKFYSFIELDKTQFNQSVKLIRDRLYSKTIESNWMAENGSSSMEWNCRALYYQR